MLDTFLQRFNDLLLPPHCVHCRSDESWFCQRCRQKISFIDHPICERCGTLVATDTPKDCHQCQNNRLQHITGIRSAAFFEDNPIRSAIHELKYRNHKAIAHELGKILTNSYRQYNLTADIIIPVPLHRSRLKQRGYNQSEMLAKPLGKALDLPVNTKALSRVRKTKSQMKLSAAERHENVVDAFSCSDTKLAGQEILLIDDVCTTGSTLDACAAALKQNKVFSVWGLTIAKAR